MENKFIPLALASFALAAAPAHAAVLAEYLFNGNPASPASSDTDPDSTAGDFLRSTTSGFGYSNGENNAFAATHVAAPGGLTFGTVANAVAYDNYFSFTVTPDSGQMFNLTELTYTSIHNNTAVSEGAAVAGNDMNFFVLSSVNGFDTTGVTVFSQAHNTTVNGRTVDLTGSSFQGVEDPVTFRFYAFTDEDIRNNQGARLDDVVLNGTVEAVPEPSAALLGGLGALLLLRRRR